MQILDIISKIFHPDNSHLGFCGVFIFIFFWPCPMACGILVPQPGIEHMSPVVEAQRPNSWITTEVLGS